jgi:DNA primase catalytic core
LKLMTPREKTKSKTGRPKGPDRALLLHLNGAAMRYWHDSLLASPRTLQYLADRGWSDPAALAARYQLGLAIGKGDEGEGFVRHLLRNKSLWDGVTDRLVIEEALIDAGLARRHDSGRLLDYFYGRLIFPIARSGTLDTLRAAEIVGFGGRVLPWAVESRPDGGEGPPKYLNTRTTALFDKGKLLYGGAWAEESIRKIRKAVIVEGYMDLLRVREAGFNHVVAQCGTALTPAHVGIIIKAARLDRSGYGPNGIRLEVTLATDTDAAGRRAAERGARLIMAGRAVARVATFDGGKDPDDLIRQAGEQGHHVFSRVLESAVTPAIRYLDEQAERKGGEPWRTSLRALVATMHNVSQRASGGTAEQANEDARRAADRFRTRARLEFLEDAHLKRLFAAGPAESATDWQVGT